ncbi:MAG: aldo/keto reductase [Acidobacteriota bacterium]|nr:aldo/keto reductase [Acidobacteriota bacterium]
MPFTLLRHLSLVANNFDIPYRTLGHTGEGVSCIGMGGFHLGKPDISEKKAIALIHAGLDRGINFLDNSWDYNKGESERRMGKALKESGYRQRAFLMTKIDGRTKKSAASQIEESLKRLDTDHVDLLQFHEVIRFEDPDRIFAKDGAMEAFLDAKKAGKTRYIGFTGHKDPRIHLYMLEVADRHGFTFDAVQMPINVMDAHYRSFGHLVAPELVKRNIGVLGMKSMGDGVILKSKTVTPMECLQYALRMPTSVVITGIDTPAILDQAMEAAHTDRQLSQEQLDAILAKTKQAAGNGDWELFKTSGAFDSTAENLEWLGEKSPHVKEFAPI